MQPFSPPLPAAVSSSPQRPPHNRLTSAQKPSRPVGRQPRLHVEARLLGCRDIDANAAHISGNDQRKGAARRDFYGCEVCACRDKLCEVDDAVVDVELGRNAGAGGVEAVGRRVSGARGLWGCR
jgi:hypothetical protein